MGNKHSKEKFHSKHKYESDSGSSSLHGRCPAYVGVSPISDRYLWHRTYAPNLLPCHSLHCYMPSILLDQPHTQTMMNASLESLSGGVPGSSTTTTSTESSRVAHRDAQYFGILSYAHLQEASKILEQRVFDSAHITVNKQVFGDHLLLFLSFQAICLLLNNPEMILASPQSNDIEYSDLNLPALQVFLQQIEQLYFDCPFHNRVRAAMRVHTVYQMVRHMYEPCFKRTEILALLIAAATKDVLHPGLNNHFQTISNSAVARLYNYDLPLENFACATTFLLMKQDLRCNFLSRFSAQNREEFRTTLIYLCVESSRNNIGVYAREIEDLMAQFEQPPREKEQPSLHQNIPHTQKPLTQMQKMALSSDGKKIFLPFLLHMAEEVHMWNMRVDGHRWWQTASMKEFMFQSDVESLAPMPLRTIPARENISLTDYKGYMDQKFSIVDQGLFQLAELCNIGDVHLVMQSNSDFWENYVTEESSLFQSLKEPFSRKGGQSTPHHFQNRLEKMIQMRKLDIPKLNISLSVQQVLAHSLLWTNADQENFYALVGRRDTTDTIVTSTEDTEHSVSLPSLPPYAEGGPFAALYGHILETLFVCLAPHGLKFPNSLQVAPTLVVSELNPESLDSARQLSYRERLAGIYYHLSMFNDLNQDVFSLTALLNDCPLVLLGMLIMESRGLLNEFHVPHEKMIHFFWKVQLHYFMNPYHNAIHAADVFQAVHCLLRTSVDGKGIPSFFTFALLIAACGHDIDHPGFSNKFLQSSDSYLAKLYNDRSVMESHSSAVLMELLQDVNCSILQNLAPELSNQIRQTVVHCTLSTDMERHQDLMNRFAVFHPGNFGEDEDVLFAMGMILKMADIANSFRPQRVFIQWARRISLEFLKERDYERLNECSEGKPADQGGAYSFFSSQLLFVNAIVKPLFDLFVNQFPESRIYEKNFLDNLAYLQSEVEKENQQQQAQ